MGKLIQRFTDPLTIATNPFSTSVDTPYNPATDIIDLSSEPSSPATTTRLLLPAPPPSKEDEDLQRALANSVALEVGEDEDTRKAIEMSLRDGEMTMETAGPPFTRGREENDRWKAVESLKTAEERIREDNT